MFKYWWSAFQVTFPSSSFLLFGWAAFFISLGARFEVPASGGFMVAMAIIAELWLSHRWRYGSFAEMTRSMQQQDAIAMQIPFTMPEDYQCAEATGANVAVDGQAIRFDVLQAARTDSDIVNSAWRPARTINRLRRGLVPWIASTALVGTLVWAYGHLFITNS